MNDAGRSRAQPSWFSHQRHVLAALCRAIEAALDRRGSPGPRRTVLDLGCGDRPYEPMLRARGWDYVACDLDGPVDVRIVPGQPLPLESGSAVGVTSFQVLEHVWDLDAYLGEARRLLEPGGWLLLSTHGVWLYHPHPTDYRRWTRDGLTRELESRGFVVERVASLVGPLAWTTHFRLLGYRDVLRRIPLVGPAVVALLAAVMNARMVLEDALTPAAVRERNACVYLVECRKA